MVISGLEYFSFLSASKLLSYSFKTSDFCFKMFSLFIVYWSLNCTFMFCSYRQTFRFDELGIRSCTYKYFFLNWIFCCAVIPCSFVCLPSFCILYQCRSRISFSNGWNQIFKFNLCHRSSFIFKITSAFTITACKL